MPRSFGKTIYTDEMVPSFMMHLLQVALPTPACQGSDTYHSDVLIVPISAFPTTWDWITNLVPIGRANLPSTQAWGDSLRVPSRAGSHPLVWHSCWDRRLVFTQAEIEIYWSKRLLWKWLLRIDRFPENQSIDLMPFQFLYVFQLHRKIFRTLVADSMLYRSPCTLPQSAV